MAGARNSGREQRAKALWARAVKIFDDTLGKATQSDDGWGLLALGDNVKQSVPGEQLAYYGIALRMVGRRPEAISVLRQVTEDGLCRAGDVPPSRFGAQG